MTTYGDIAANEARALRLVLASLRAHDDAEEGTQATRMVLDEIDCVECYERLTAVLAPILAEEMSLAYGPKVARELEKRITGLLDFAADRREPPT